MNKLIKSTLALAGALLLISACSPDPKTFEDEVRHLYQDRRGFMYIRIPPALLTLALRAADDPGMTRFFGDARQVGLISFGEEYSREDNAAIIRTLEELLVKYQYEDLIRISDSEKLISMKMKESGNRVTDMVTIISEREGPLMAVTLSGDIDIQQIVLMASEFDFSRLMELQAMGGRR